MLGVVGNLDHADMFTHCFHFIGYMAESIGPSEGRRFLRLVLGARKPQRMLQPEGHAHHRTARDETVIKRGGFLAAALWQGFIGIGKAEAA